MLMEESWLAGTRFDFECQLVISGLERHAARQGAFLFLKTE